MDPTNRMAMLWEDSRQIGRLKTSGFPLLMAVITILAVVGCSPRIDPTTNVPTTSTPAPAGIGSHVGQKLPETTLLMADSSERSLPSATGGKPSLLYFFTTW